MAKTSAANDEALPGVFGDDIRLPKLSHLVAAKLRDQIVSGNLKPGSLLLPENQMLERFNVSRPTLREAMRILEAESLITIGRGMRKGAIVRGPTIEKAIEFTSFMLVSEGVSMRDMHEARMYFEPAIIRHLKGENLDTAVAELRECVNRMVASHKKRDYFAVIAGTNRFHEALVRASRNKTMSLVCAILQSISDEAYNINIAAEGFVSRSLDRNMEKTTLGYSNLCDLLEKGKTMEAASFWRTYMERALEFLIRSGIGEKLLVPHSGLAALSE
jgi:GntR family transcriptional regulator, transcriptional repressor for pyruvate dehydrogenase complex